MAKIAIKYPILGSSVDATKVSMFVKGLVGFVVIMLASFGLSGVEIDGLANQIVQAVELIGQLITLLAVIYGGIRKIIVWFQNR